MTQHAPVSRGKDKPAATRPHFEGHRQRLKERFRDAGADALPDYELLELILFRPLPRRDTKPIAKALIKRFGSFAEVISADSERLREIDGVGEAVATELKLVRAAALRLMRSELMSQPTISSGPALIEYCRAAMAFSTREQFRVLFLDRKNKIIADEIQQEGTIDHAPVYPREVVKRALELSATGLILVHNHPSGDPTPSSADVDMTRRIAEAAQNLGIVVHDHIVIGRQGHASLRQLKLM